MINIPNVQLPKRRIIIPKFTPGGTVTSSAIGNRKNTDPLFWDNFNQQIINRWGEIGSGQDYTLDELNQFLRTNRRLYKSLGYSETGDAIRGDEVNQFQRDFHNKYQFGNGDAEGNGGLWTPFITTNEYGKTYNLGDVSAPSGQFTGDDYYGEQTNHRRASFFNDDELAQANQAVKSRGWEFVLDNEQMDGYTVGEDGRKFYMLRETPTIPPKKSIIPPPEDIPPLDFKKPSENKREPFTDWIPHVINGVADMIKATKLRKLAHRFNPPLKQAPYQHYEKTDNYALNQAYKQQAADTLAQGNRNLTSDSTLNTSQKLAYYDKASQLEQKGELAKAQQYADSTDKANTIGWGNVQRGTEIANENRRIIGATEQYLNEANQKEIIQKTDAIKNAVSGIWTDAKKYVQTTQLNDAHLKNRDFQKGIADQKNALISQYNQSWGDFSNSDYFNQWRNYVNDPNNAGKFGEIPENDGDGWLRTNWTTHEEARRFRDEYEKSKSQAYYQLQQQLASLNQQAQLGPDQPAYFMGQLTWDAFSPQSRSRLSPAFYPQYKKGGKLDKMAEYIKTIQREQESVRNNQVKSRNSELRQLEKELDRINQKQILLLKEIFG